MQAEAKVYALEFVMQAVSNTDPKVLEAITSTGMNPEQLIARSFQVIAEHADKIGQLKISTELLAPCSGGHDMNSKDIRIILVTRRTRLEELIARHNTPEQALFYVERLGGEDGLIACVLPEPE